MFKEKILKSIALGLCMSALFTGAAYAQTGEGSAPAYDAGGIAEDMVMYKTTDEKEDNVVKAENERLLEKDSIIVNDIAPDAPVSNSNVLIDETGAADEETLTIQIQAIDEVVLDGSEEIYQTTAVDDKEVLEKAEEIYQTTVDKDIDKDSPEVQLVNATDDRIRNVGAKEEDNKALSAPLVILIIAGGAIIIGGSVILSNKKKADK